MNHLGYRICPSCGYINKSMVLCKLCGYCNGLLPHRLLTDSEMLAGEHGANRPTWHCVNPTMFLRAFLVLREGGDIRAHNRLVRERFAKE